MLSRRQFLAAPLLIDRARNPVLSFADWSIKDATLVKRGEEWFFFFDAAFEDRGRMRFHAVSVSTRDFRTFSPPIFLLDGREQDWIGMASPEICMAPPDRYIVSYNSWGDKPGTPNQLFARTSTDLRRWSGEIPLAANLTRGVRAIDAAVAWDRNRYFVMYKEQQRTRIAMGESLEGDFRPVGDGFPRFQRGDTPGPWHENYQLFRYRSRWHVMTTADNHDPFLYAMHGDGSREEHWLHWREGRRIEIPRQSFNQADRANSASLVLGLPEDGPQYLLYAGNNEKKTYQGRGWNRLGLARSLRGFDGFVPLPELEIP